MALFGKEKETKEEKEARKVTEMMSEYGLTSLDTHDVESVRSIMSDLAGSGFLKFGALLSAKGEDNAKIAYLSAICEQNWIIIRQLDRISKALEK